MASAMQRQGFGQVPGTVKDPAGQLECFNAGIVSLQRRTLYTLYIPNVYIRNVYIRNVYNRKRKNQLKKNVRCEKIKYRFHGLQPGSCTRKRV